MGAKGFKWREVIAAKVIFKSLQGDSAIDSPPADLGREGYDHPAIVPRFDLRKTCRNHAL